MGSFLDKHVSSGPSIKIDEAGISFAAESTFNGHIAVFHWTREEVTRLLPPDLELAVNPLSGPEVHPVALVFGDQTEGAWIVGGRRLPLGFAYQELALAIPFVRRRGGRYLHVHVPRMYSSYFPVVWNGNAQYGLGKRMGRMTIEGPFFVLTDGDGTLLLHAAVEPRGGWVPGPACGWPNFAAVREMIALPFVGRTARGIYTCSYFGWDFAGAQVRPVDCSVSFDAPIVDGLTSRWCYDTDMASFEVRGMAWRLTWPMACRF
jgi:hypothetical protein